MKKRILSLLLVLTIVLSMLPASVFADMGTGVQWKGTMNYNDYNNVVGSLGEKTPTSKEYTAESWYTVADAKGYPSTQVIIGDYLYCYNGKLVKYDLNGNKLAESEAFGIPNSIGWYEYLTATDDGEYIFVTFSGTNKDYVIKVSDLSVALETDKLENSNYPTAQFHNGYLFCNGTIYKFETSPELKLSKVGTKIGTRTVTQTIDEAQKDVTFSMSFAWSSGAFVKHGQSQTEWFYVTGYDNNKEITKTVNKVKTVTQYASENYQKGILYAVDYTTGEIMDTFIPEESWLSSTATTGQTVYDSVSGYLYWGSYSAKKMFAIKINADGTFDDDSYTSVELNQTTVCSPIIYNGRAYFAGNSGYINVIDVNPQSADFMKLIYTTSNQIYKIQSNPIAFTDADENIYIYVQSYVASGHLYCLKDTNTAAAGTLELIATPSQLVSYDAETFSGTQSGAFAFEQICKDAQGRIYVVNDSGYLYCFEKTPVKLPSVTNDLSTDYVKYNMLDNEDTVEALSVASISLDDGIISYQWQKSNDKITWTDISGETSAAYTPVKEIGHFYYRCKITNTKETKNASVFSKNADVEIKNFSSDKTVQYILTSSNSASGKKQELQNNHTILLTSDQTKYRVWLDAPENGNITLSKVYGNDIFSVAENQSNYEYRFFCNAGVKDINVFEILVTAEDGSQETITLNVAPASLSEAEQTVTVSAVAQKSGSIIYVTDGALTVGSKAAENYGYTDKINYMIGASSLDTLVSLHKEIYGNDYTSETAVNYLAVSNDGTISKMFGVETGNVGFIVNGAYPNDGTEAQWGGYNGLNINQVKVKNSDKLEFFIYQDSYGQDTYTYLEVPKEAELNENADIAVTGLCYGWSGYLYKNASEMKAAATSVAAVSIGAVDIKTGNISYLASSDENGRASVKFNKAGTYYLAAYGTDSNGTPIIMTLSKLEVLPCVHTLVHHQAVAATTTSEGNTEYWECTGCGKYYSNAAGTAEIAENSWITSKIVTPPVTPDETEITIYITVLGDTEHGDEGTRHTLSAGNLTTWVSKRSVIVEDNSTVWDAMQQLSSNLNGAITYANPSGNYFSAVTYNGTTLGEIDNGALSGWMYTLNGTHPNLGVSEQKLSAGDEIVIHYTDDYTAEEGSESWDEPYVPSSDDSGTASKQETKTENKTEEIKQTVEVKSVDAKEGKAEVSVDTKTLGKSIDSIIKNAEKSESGADKKAQSIEIKAEVKGDAKEVNISLPTDSLKTIAEKTNATVDVKTPNGNVAMPTDALAEIVKQAGGKDIQINVETKKAEDVKEAVTEKLTDALKDVPAKADGTKFDEKTLENATAVEFNITAGDKNITSFGGNRVEVSVPVDKAKYEDGKYYRTFILSKDGSVDAASGKIEGEAAKVVMRHFSTVIITTEEVSPFLDIKLDAWYAGSAAKVYELGLINGVSDGIFDGGSNLSRAMLVTILIRMEGSPDMEKIDSFPDVKKGSWYEKAAIWAAENGIVKGADGLFLPDKDISREETVTIFQRYAKYKNKDVSKTADLTEYTDSALIDVWAKNAVSWANAEGLLTGYSDKSLDPRGFISRAEAAVLLTRYIEKINK